jgi:hypothetical protein
MIAAGCTGGDIVTFYQYRAQSAQGTITGYPGTGGSAANNDHIVIRRVMHPGVPVADFQMQPFSHTISMVCLISRIFEQITKVKRASMREIRPLSYFCNTNCDNTFSLRKTFSTIRRE